MSPTNPRPTPWPSSTHPPNPSLPASCSPSLHPSTTSFGEGVTTFLLGTQPAHYETLYPTRDGPHVQHSVMDEEQDEQDNNSTSSNPPTQLHKTKPNCNQEHSSPTGKQFAVKLYEMLGDGTVMDFVRWGKSGSLDALYIPDIKAFEVNVMPKYFKEMRQWGSFQRQLHNYGFEKRDRGAGKALYAHSGNKFCKGRPDLLPKVLRKPNSRMKAIIAQDLASPARGRATTPIEPTIPQSTSQINPYAEVDKLGRELERVVLRLSAMEGQLSATQDQLKAPQDRLKAAEDRVKAADDRVKAAEDRLKATEDRLLLLESQIVELSRKLERVSSGDDRFKTLLVLLVCAYPRWDQNHPLDLSLHSNLRSLDPIPSIINNLQVATNTSANTSHQAGPTRLKTATSSPQLSFNEWYRENQGSEVNRPHGILAWILIQYLKANPRPILHELVSYIHSKDHASWTDKQARK